MNTWLQKSLVGVLLVAFIGVVSFGAMMLSHEVHTVHERCPFAADEQGICPMMSLKQVNFFPATGVVIIGIIGILLISLRKAIVLILEKQQVRVIQLRRKKKIPLYQQLFSQGILNPKAP